MASQHGFPHQVPSKDAIIPARPAKAAGTSAKVATKVAIEKTTDPEAATPPAAKSVRASLLDIFWVIEVATLTVAIGVLISLVITLKLYDHTPRTLWPISIQINTLVAILATIIKPAALFPVTQCFVELKWLFSHQKRSAYDLAIFEQASRGPWGALKLFFKKFGMLASLGAFITILTMGMDPFIQEMVRYQPCLTTLNLTASNETSADLFSLYDDTSIPMQVAQVNTYTQYNSAEVNSTTYQLAQEVRGAFYDGIFDPPGNASEGVWFECPYANCTVYPQQGIAYSSLMMCSEVTDLTDQIVSSRMQGGLELDDVTELYEYQGYSLPSGLWVSTEASGLPVLNSNTFNSLYPNTSNMNALFSFEVLTFQKTYDDFGEPTGQLLPFAFAASLYPCVGTFTNVSVINNTLYETHNKTTPLVWSETSQQFSLAGEFPNVHGSDCDPSDVVDLDSGKNESTLVGPNGARFVATPEEISNATPEMGPVQYYNYKCTYQFDSNTTQGIRNLTNTFFGSSNSLNSTGSKLSATAGPYEMQFLLDRGNINISNAEDYVAGIANSLSGLIRGVTLAAGYPGNADLASSTSFDDTCITVQWPYVTLPACILGFTCILLFGTAVALRKSGFGRARPSVSRRRRNARSFSSAFQRVVMKVGSAGVGATDMDSNHGGSSARTSLDSNRSAGGTVRPKAHSKGDTVIRVAERILEQV